MRKTIAVYFSRADENYFAGSLRYIEVGNTEIAVKNLCEIIETDVFKIEMVKPYAKDYMTCIEEAKLDFQMKRRPKLLALPVNMNEYNTIILAYPNYWGSVPMAVMSFLEAFDFTGKTILPLCTHEGSGMGNSEEDIKKICKGAYIKKGLPILGSNVSEAKPLIMTWLEENGCI